MLVQKNTAAQRAVFLNQIIDKPGFVEANHLSRLTVAGRLKRVQFGLADTNE